MSEDATPNDEAEQANGTADNRDVLAGWDPNGDPCVRTPQDAPFPVDLVALAGGALAGTLGAIAVRKSSLFFAATLGTIVGSGIAIGARRMWRLEP